MDHEPEPQALPFGELFSEPTRLRGGLRLLRRAMRERWPIPDGSRRVLLERVSLMLQEPGNVSEGTRERVIGSAVEVFLEADRENLRRVYEALGKPLADRRVHRTRHS